MASVFISYLNPKRGSSPRFVPISNKTRSFYPSFRLLIIFVSPCRLL